MGIIIVLGSFIGAVVGIIIGGITGFVKAKKRNANKFLWVFGGMVIGMLVIGVIAFGISYLVVASQMT